MFFVDAPVRTLYFDLDMTQKEKQLLFKDLCARLPYGFTIHRYSDNRDIIFEPNELDEFAHFLEYSEGEEFKPYLRPMSSMTEEEENEYINTFLAMWDAVDWLNAHHFDYRGLIIIMSTSARTCSWSG